MARERRSLLDPAARWFEGRNERQKYLLLAGLMVMMLAFFKGVVADGLIQQHGQLRKQVIAARTQAAQLRDRWQARQVLLTAAERQRREEIARLTGELMALAREKETLAARLVSSADMARLLETLVQKHRGVQLEFIENLPVEPLNQTVMTDEEEVAPPVKQIYKHPLRIALRGGYFDIVGYLEALEQSEWAIFWDEFSLTAKYPVSQVVVELYTLSFDEAWFEV